LAKGTDIPMDMIMQFSNNLDSDSGELEEILNALNGTAITIEGNFIRVEKS
jgi:hypothetical protein